MTLSTSLPELYKKDFRGFCYVFASFNEICAKKNKEQINNCFIQKDDGSTDVKFGKIQSNVSQKDLKAFSESSIFMGKPKHNDYNKAEIFTVAYIEHMSHKNLADLPQENIEKLVDQYAGGLPDNIFNELSDDKTKSESFSADSGPLISENTNKKTYEIISRNFETFLDKNQNNCLVAITPTTEYGSRKVNGAPKKGFYSYTTMDPAGNIVTDHCYSVTNIDREKKEITLHDANMADVTGDKNGMQYKEGKFTLTYDEFFRYFKTFEAFPQSKTDITSTKWNS